jgi:hypothetical protein
LGSERKTEQWEQRIRKSVPLAYRIERLAPALALDNENPEYPWPRAAPEIAPAEHAFEIWEELQKGAGLQFLDLTTKLFAAADAYL